MTKELTNSEFENFIKKGVVLIDFFADWCMPCMIMSPIIDEISEKFKGKVKVGKMNIDNNLAIAQKFGVSSIPNFVIFKNGKVVEQFVGGISAEDLRGKLRKFV